MSIIRNTLRKKYTQLPNRFITDNRVSNGAFRLGAYLYSRPDNWTVNNVDIMKQLGIGSEKTLAKYWKELITTGWLARELKRDENGRLNGSYDHVLTEPALFTESVEIPKWEKYPNGKNTQMGKSAGYNKTDSINKTEYNNNNYPEGVEEEENLQFQTPNTISLKDENKTPVGSQAAAPPVEQWANDLLADDLWCERTAQHYRLQGKKEIINLLDNFILQKRQTEELTHRTFKDFKKNFYFWIGSYKLHNPGTAAPAPTQDPPKFKSAKNMTDAEFRRMIHGTPEPQKKYTQPPAWLDISNIGKG